MAQRTVTRQVISALSNTPVEIGDADIYGYTIHNTTAATVFIKFYADHTAGDSITGVVPEMIIPVRANSDLILNDNGINQFSGDNIFVAAITTLSNATTTAPASSIYMEVVYS